MNFKNAISNWVQNNRLSNESTIDSRLKAVKRREEDLQQQLFYQLILNAAILVKLDKQWQGFIRKTRTLKDENITLEQIWNNRLINNLKTKCNQMKRDIDQIRTESEEIYALSRNNFSLSSGHVLLSSELHKWRWP